MTKRFTITARVLPDGTTFLVIGREAHTLVLLTRNGAAGVTACDFRGGPPFRLPAYCWAPMEKHDAGWRGRLVLHSAVEIIHDHRAVAA